MELFMSVHSCVYAFHAALFLPFFFFPYLSYLFFFLCPRQPFVALYNFQTVKVHQLRYPRFLFSVRQF